MQNIVQHERRLVGRLLQAFSIALLVEGLLACPVGRWIDRGHERTS